MTRLDAGILTLLCDGPYTVVDIAQTLNESIEDVRRSLRRLDAADVVEHTTDGWQLTRRVAA